MLIKLMIAKKKRNKITNNEKFAFCHRHFSGQSWYYHSSRFFVEQFLAQKTQNYCFFWQNCDACFENLTASRLDHKTAAVSIFIKIFAQCRCVFNCVLLLNCLFAPSLEEWAGKKTSEHLGTYLLNITLGSGKWSLMKACNFFIIAVCGKEQKRQTKQSLLLKHIFVFSWFYQKLVQFYSVHC